MRKFGRSENGYYAIHTGNAELIKAYCDLSSADGPWTVIQRRIFNTAPLEYPRTSWAKYRDGFGDSASNFWLGNKHVHELTKIPHRLKIVLYTEFLVYEAIYEDFSIGDEASKFVLNFGSYSGEVFMPYYFFLGGGGHKFIHSSMKSLFLQRVKFSGVGHMNIVLYNLDNI